MEIFFIIGAIVLGLVIDAVEDHRTNRRNPYTNYKKYDKERKDIAWKYSVNPYDGPTIGAYITPANPGYVKYIKELSEYEKEWGKEAYISVEEAIKLREKWLENWKKRGGELDEAGYALDVCGNRMS